MHKKTEEFISLFKPDVFVVSAPSGTGKTTLNTRLTKECPQVAISVSHTTRLARNGEVSGLSYHFVSREEFKSMIASDHMLEWAEVFGNLYGTSKSEIARIHGLQKHVLLEIDVQGARSILNKVPKATTIFILPPSIESLWNRLEGRGTDSIENRWKRLMTAKHEIEVGYLYENFIVNDDKDRAFSELKSIIHDGSHSRMTRAEGIAACEKLVLEFETSSLLRELRVKLA